MIITYSKVLSILIFSLCTNIPIPFRISLWKMLILINFAFMQSLPQLTESHAMQNDKFPSVSYAANIFGLLKNCFPQIQSINNSISDSMSIEIPYAKCVSNYFFTLFFPFSCEFKQKSFRLMWNCGWHPVTMSLFVRQQLAALPPHAFIQATYEYKLMCEWWKLMMNSFVIDNNEPNNSHHLDDTSQCEWIINIPQQ